MNSKGGPDGGTMPFLEHLEELRWRIIKGLSAVLVFSIGVYVFWKKIFELIIAYPLKGLDPKPKIIFTTPSEAFMASLKIAVFGGVLLASPIVLYQIWRFVAPGLFKKERKYAVAMILVSAFCFAIGVGFSYIAVPYAIKFLTEFRTESLAPFYSINPYLTFILKLTMAFGVVFQMPAASLILTRAGLITHKTLLSYWRVAIVIVFLIAAFITPPDIVSQALMAGPLLVLYFISVLISKLTGRKDGGT